MATNYFDRCKTCGTPKCENHGEFKCPKCYPEHFSTVSNNKDTKNFKQNKNIVDNPDFYGQGVERVVEPEIN